MLKETTSNIIVELCMSVAVECIICQFTITLSWIVEWQIPRIDIAIQFSREYDYPVYSSLIPFYSIRVYDDGILYWYIFLMMLRVSIWALMRVDCRMSGLFILLMQLTLQYTVLRLLKIVCETMIFLSANGRMSWRR